MSDKKTKAYIYTRVSTAMQVEGYSLDAQQEPVTDYDEGMVSRLIERITVFEDHLAFEFKCGLQTEVQS